jgi:drug/metabolite transporter (DMT)-like permease
VTSTDQLCVQDQIKPAGLSWAIASTLLFGVAASQAGQPKPASCVALVQEADDDVGLPRCRTRAVAAFAPPAEPRPRSWSMLGSPSWSALELVGTISYARGAEVGLVSIVTAASATYPLIPVLGGVVLLHERPVPTQYLGIAMVIGGLVLLGVA